MSIWMTTMRKSEVRSMNEQHSKDFYKYKQWYDDGFYTKKMLRNIVAKGKLTPEEYYEITGEEF